MESRNRSTVHPGEVLQEEFLIPLKMSQVDFAQHIGVSFQTINNLINGKRGVSIDMAYLLAAAFDTTPEFWLNLQMNHDLKIHKPVRNVKKLIRAS